MNKCMQDSLLHKKLPYSCMQNWHVLGSRAAGKASIQLHAGLGVCWSCAAGKSCHALHAGLGMCWGRVLQEKASLQLYAGLSASFAAKKPFIQLHAGLGMCWGRALQEEGAMQLHAGLVMCWGRAQQETLPCNCMQNWACAEVVCCRKSCHATACRTGHVLRLCAAENSYITALCRTLCISCCRKGCHSGAYRPGPVLGSCAHRSMLPETAAVHLHAGLAACACTWAIQTHLMLSVCSCAHPHDEGCKYCLQLVLRCCKTIPMQLWWKKDLCEGLHGCLV